MFKRERALKTLMFRQKKLKKPNKILRSPPKRPMKTNLQGMRALTKFLG
jgi:hypothetical protein